MGKYEAEKAARDAYTMADAVVNAPDAGDVYELNARIKQLAIAVTALSVAIQERDRP